VHTIEALYLIDFLLSFFVDYFDDRTERVEKNVLKIANHYFLKGFWWDLIALLPLHLLRLKNNRN
jgi:hypothetical protein